MARYKRYSWRGWHLSPDSVYFTYTLPKGEELPPGEYKVTVSEVSKKDARVAIIFAMAD